MEATYQMIKEDVLSVLRDRFDISLSAADHQKHFFSQSVRLDEIALLYLVFILEERYHTRFTEDDFLNDAFFTFDGLIQCLVKNTRILRHDYAQDDVS